MKKYLWMSLTALITTVVACSNDQDGNALQQGASGGSSSEVITSQFALNGFEQLKNQHYEGWHVGAQGVVSTGRFNLSDNGDVYSVNQEGAQLQKLGSKSSSLFTYSGKVSDGDLFILTIEPDGDTDLAPSSVHYVGGRFLSKSLSAITENDSAIGAEFMSSQGQFFLATPTNGPTTHNQGIWFIKQGQAGLSLPQLNTGWAYEGWVVNTETGEVTSTGVFRSATRADSDLGGPAAGPNPAPPFPGQDFINPAKILNDGKHISVISIEPFPDFDPAPFTLKILRGDIALNAPVTTDILMTNISNEDQISMSIQLK